MLCCDPKTGADKIPAGGGPARMTEPGSPAVSRCAVARSSLRPQGLLGEPVPPLLYYFTKLDPSLPATANSIRHVVIFVFTTAGKARGARIGCEYGEH